MPARRSVVGTCAALSISSQDFEASLAGEDELLEIPPRGQLGSMYHPLGHAVLAQHLAMARATSLSVLTPGVLRQALGDGCLRWPGARGLAEQGVAKRRGADEHVGAVYFLACRPRLSKPWHHRPSPTCHVARSLPSYGFPPLSCSCGLRWCAPRHEIGGFVHLAPRGGSGWPVSHASG